jgi:hypothetical protein
MLTLLQVGDGQDASDAFSDTVSGGRIDSQFVQSNRDRITNTHMRVILAAEPFAIFCTRRVSSSPLSSASCFAKSAFGLMDMDKKRRCSIINSPDYWDAVATYLE